MNGHSLSQSVSIMEYLEEIYPENPILPKDDPIARATVRRLSGIIASDIQPVQVSYQFNCL